MRLHRLVLEAFGPFASRQEVDFDVLTEQGIFLLHGPTGAGKTSVLDALCFALFGRVPGARAGVSRLRSDHADPSVAPQVCCEFSVGTRRLEITRSPAWQRPKRRGTGVTTEQARVVVREWDGRAWTTLTQRLDEAGHLVDAVIGLGPEQFTTLVVLPQGDFAAFLRADAETRRRLLERLFGTDRFTQVQGWLRDARSRLRARVDEADTASKVLLARADQVAQALREVDTLLGVGVPVSTGDPTRPDAADGPAPGEEEIPPSAQVAAVAGRAARIHEAAEARARWTAACRREASAARAQGAARADLQARHARLTGRRQELDARAADREEAARRLAEDRRAAPAVPLLELLARVGTRVDELRERVNGDPRSGADERTLREEVAALRERLGILASAERDETTLAQLTERAVSLRDDVADRRDAWERAKAELATGAVALAELGARRAACAERVQARAAAEASVHDAALRTEAVEARDRLDGEHRAATARLARAREHRDARRSAWLDLREERLAGIAAELAGDLRAGEPCRVCGGTDHPAPASPGARVVTPAQEEAARAAADAAEHEYTVSATAVGALAEDLARATALAQDADPAEAAEALATARAVLAEVVRAQEELRAIDGEQARREDAVADARRRVDQLQEAVTSGSQELSGLDEQLRGLRERVDRARDGASSLSARREGLVTEVTAVEGVLAARVELAGALAEQTRVLDDAQARCRDGGFADLAAVSAAVLASTERAQLDRLVREHDSELAAVTDQLADPGLAEAATAPGPDLPALATAVEDATAADEAAARAEALARTSSLALAELTRELAAHERRTDPLRTRFRALDALARCADGTGGDNQLHLALSAYVLAARLEQVAEAANRRLATMSGGRYALVHIDPEGGGRGRAGLDLRVLDAWTGQAREVASLSGGETFCASLALALGLADVVSAEAGGTAIETLFVDEGFGSLDTETLEDVMEVLDGLREGGRALGLISHVTDLRDRIPARLEVRKTRAGSVLRGPGTGASGPRE